MDYLQFSPRYWNAREVCNWLANQDRCFNKYLNNFLSLNIDGADLLSMNEHSLEQIGVADFHERLLICRKIKDLKIFDLKNCFVKITYNGTTILLNSLNSKCSTILKESCKLFDLCAETCILIDENQTILTEDTPITLFDVSNLSVTKIYKTLCLINLNQLQNKIVNDNTDNIVNIDENFIEQSQSINNNMLQNNNNKTNYSKYINSQQYKGINYKLHKNTSVSQSNYNYNFDADNIKNYINQADIRTKNDVVQPNYIIEHTKLNNSKSVDASLFSKSSFNFNYSSNSKNKKQKPKRPIHGYLYPNQKNNRKKFIRVVDESMEEESSSQNNNSRNSINSINELNIIDNKNILNKDEFKCNSARNYSTKSNLNSNFSFNKKEVNKTPYINNLECDLNQQNTNLVLNDTKHPNYTSQTSRNFNTNNEFDIYEHCKSCENKTNCDCNLFYNRQRTKRNLKFKDDAQSKEVIVKKQIFDYANFKKTPKNKFQLANSELAVSNCNNNNNNNNFNSISHKNNSDIYYINKLEKSHYCKSDNSNLYEKDSPPSNSSNPSKMNFNSSSISKFSDNNIIRTFSNSKELNISKNQSSFPYYADSRITNKGAFNFQVLKGNNHSCNRKPLNITFNSISDCKRLNNINDGAYFSEESDNNYEREKHHDKLNNYYKEANKIKCKVSRKNLDCNQSSGADEAINLDITTGKSNLLTIFF